MSKRLSSLVVALVALSGCAVAASDGLDAPEVDVTDSVRQPMVNGTTSHTGQDATVLLVQGGQPACTGTLIAPNLVLTARHCVAEPSGNQECATFGQQTPPSALSIVLGVNARATDTPAAKGARITVPTTSNMCSFDVALIQLDREVSGAPIAGVRFGTLSPNEPTIAVGYGVDGQDRPPVQRQQRSTSVLGVGPHQLQYTTKQNAAISYSLPAGDVATGESTCYGDSGGPLFDAQGRVVAVTSRGIPEFPQTAAHGNGCVDLPSIYAGVRFHEQLIREAAQAAGHPLPASTDANEMEPQGADEVDEIDPDMEDDEEDDEATPKKKKKKAARMMVASSGGCTTAPLGSTPAALPIAGLAVALAAVARRRRR